MAEEEQQDEKQQAENQQDEQEEKEQDEQDGDGASLAGQIAKGAALGANGRCRNRRSGRSRFRPRIRRRGR